MIIDYGNVLSRHGIAPRGVVHVGGYLGHEDLHYASLGFSNRLFVEAQPDTFAALKSNLAASGAFSECVAISDRPGRATFHVASNGQSSSLLAMKNHSLVYEDIVEVRQVEVETMRLDDLLARAPYKDLAFNFLNMDIQGAELLALAGATQTLHALDMINLEVNFDELYAGAPHVTTLDHFLGAFGFVRADTVLCHATWGDAMYVRESLARVRP